MKINKSELWMETWTGVRFYPFDISINSIKIEDIAHHLSLQCRFTGAISRFYSVAQHSLHVARLTEEAGANSVTVLQALLHDATEAYMADLNHPTKCGLPSVRSHERSLWKAISTRFSVPRRIAPVVKWADDVALMTERRDLLLHHRPEFTWHCESIAPDYRRLNETAAGSATPHASEVLFLTEYDRLSKLI